MIAHSLQVVRKLLGRLSTCVYGRFEALSAAEVN